MKPTLISFVIIIVVATISRAQQFSGKIDNIFDKELQIISTNDFINYQRDTVRVDEAGFFKTSLKMESGGFITLKGKGFSIDDIYILPNSDLQIFANSQDIYGTRYYKGGESFINNYYAKIQKSVSLKQNAFGNNTYKLPEEQFIKAIDSYFLVRDSLKKEYFGNLASHNAQLIDFLLIDSIDMAYFKGYVALSYLHNAKDKIAFYHSYVKPLEKNITDSRFIKAQKFRYFWNSLIDYKLSEIRSTTADKMAQSALLYYKYIPHLINENLFGVIKKISARSYIEDITAFYVTSTAPEDAIDVALEVLYSYVNDTSYVNKQRLKVDILRKLRNNNKIGKQFKDFSAVDSTGRVYSLADLKNKTLYIDLWASWCGPCIGEFKYIDRVLTGVENPDKFMYVTISLDENKEAWKKALKKHSPPGLHLWLAGGFKSSITEYYNIKAIPHYLLIDSAGKLKQFAAPRPSLNEDLIKMINKM
ncbi:MAG: TlpA disulfide reductase family protein [Bacteroidota bacterium]